MASCFKYPTTYFWQEGKANLRDCLRIAFNAANEHDVRTIVIFTGAGEGVRVAHESFLSQPEFAHIKLVAVAFPHGHPHELGNADRDWMTARNIPVIQAHLPFDTIKSQYQSYGILGQDFSLLGNALNIFGGSISLCVQAVLMACDAGLVRKGEHVIALTSDTSILVRSAPTSHLLTDFIVREIFCKAVVMDISKKEELEASSAGSEPEIHETDPKLIEGTK